jgi:hypothetical protein
MHCEAPVIGKYVNPYIEPYQGLVTAILLIGASILLYAAFLVKDPVRRTTIALWAYLP